MIYLWNSVLITLGSVSGSYRQHTARITQKTSYWIWSWNYKMTTWPSPATTESAKCTYWAGRCGMFDTSQATGKIYTQDVED